MHEVIYRAATQSADDPAEYVLSDESVDRMGDVIMASGWELSDFRKNPIALFNHDKDAVIGRWTNVRIDGDRLLGRLVLAAAGTSRLVDEVRALFEQKMLRAVSVGFRVLKSEPLTEDADKYFGPFRFLKQQLLEASMVAVPANPNALQVSRSYPLTADAQRQLFGPSASEKLTRPSALSRVTASTTSRGRSPMSTLSRRIEAVQKELNAYRDRLDELSKIDDPSEDDIHEIDELTSKQIPETKSALERLERMEKTLGFSAADQGDADQATDKSVAIIPPGKDRPFALAKKKLEPGDLMFRAVAAGVRAFGQQVPLDHAAREMYGNDEAFNVVLRAAVNPAMTTVAGWAAELVQTANAGFLDRLVAESIYGPLSGMGARYDLGRNGSLKIPVRASTPRAAGAWVGEGAPKPVKRIGLGQVTLTPHKLAVITTFTEEIAMSSIPAIEGLLRQAMADDTAEALDGFLIDNVAASATRPAGLLNGVAPITASAAATSPSSSIRRRRWGSASPRPPPATSSSRVSTRRARSSAPVSSSAGRCLPAR
jgi:HK97 family phage prohead protease/HK97 family phage major capsid protein